MEPCILTEMTWPQAERLLRMDDRLILVTGATEQHGHHLPLGTDQFIPQMIAQWLSARTGVVVAPVLPLGMSELHMAFPGTLTLTQETLQTVYLELVQSAYRQGWRRFFVLNGHGGNRKAWEWVIALATRVKPDIRFQLTAWWQEPEVHAFSQEVYGRTEGHAGLTETAAGLVFEPDLVRLGAATAAPDQGFTGEESPEAFRATYPSGAIGERPAEATVTFGKEMIAQLVAKYARLLEEWP